MLKAFLTRLSDNGKQTLGVLRIYDDTDKVFECKTLEPAWLNNKPRVSCIPIGNYTVSFRQSPKFGSCYIINHTSPREFVLFHAGNFRSNTEGCICVGRDFGDLNMDGTPDLVSSRVTMDLMLQVVGERDFALVIV
jgi:hypothetical protein